MLDRLFSLLPTVLERGLAEAERGSIDFTDMLYVPVMKQLPVPVFDLVSIDEAQDYSAAALEFTVRLAAAGARLVFVGDPRQSIFGFAGAAPRALERTAERLAAAVLPLSVTYRCPRLHVELARQLAPELEVPATAPGGRVVVLAERELPAWVRAGDLIICRLNAPLVGLCLRLLTRGHRAFVKGVDLQARLQALAGRVFRHGFRQPQQQLRKFLAAELARFGEDGAPAAGAAADRLRDECACLQHFLTAGAGCPDRAALSALIEAAFAGDERSVVLSSIHRAKGMEADRVVLLQPELLPAPYARSGSALEAEACVQFVALTRARRELVFTEPGHVRAVDTPPAASGGVLSVPPADRRAEVIAVWQSILLRARSGRRYRTQHGNRAAGRRNR
ncbi:MAG TPA: UvrD-helicase domain-containing protein, partial [Deinococcales bacterium]|nr:UvrD-helicase domain-containing protein [Deinococcales bacterium]